MELFLWHLIEVEAVFIVAAILSAIIIHVAKLENRFYVILAIFIALAATLVGVAFASKAFLTDYTILELKQYRLIGLGLFAATSGINMAAIVRYLLANNYCKPFVAGLGSLLLLFYQGGAFFALSLGNAGINCEIARRIQSDSLITAVALVVLLAVDILFFGSLSYQAVHGTLQIIRSSWSVFNQLIPASLLAVLLFALGALVLGFGIKHIDDTALLDPIMWLFFALMILSAATLVYITYEKQTK